MMTSRAMRARAERRGIVLVLVLAMLGLLALVAVTFATYAGQSKITIEFLCNHSFSRRPTS